MGLKPVSSQNLRMYEGFAWNEQIKKTKAIVSGFNWLMWLLPFVVCFSPTMMPHGPSKRPQP